MAETFDHINEKHVAFINNQHVFFVASATSDSHVNLSPKGMDSFRVLGPNRVAYLDITGSTNETAAHMLADGRITFLFTSFAKKPLNLRLYGKGHAVHLKDDAFEELAKNFPSYPGIRQIIVADIHKVTTNCGYSIPEMELVRERPSLIKWAENKGEDGIKAYQKENNTRSMDGLPTGIDED